MLGLVLETRGSSRNSTSAFDFTPSTTFSHPSPARVELNPHQDDTLQTVDMGCSGGGPDRGRGAPPPAPYSSAVPRGARILKLIDLCITQVRLLEDGADVHEPDSVGTAALHYAAEKVSFL